MRTLPNCTQCDLGGGGEGIDGGTHSTAELECAASLKQLTLEEQAPA